MAAPRLQAGRVYRTRDLRRYEKNPTRLAGKLVDEGRLRRLRKGLYYAPRQGAFGEAPPTEEAVLRGFFGGRRYLRTGPSVWSALGLGATAVEVLPLVYNDVRTGEVQLGKRRFELRRVRFPRKPSAEYLVIDLLDNAGRAGLDLEVARKALAAAVRAGRFDRGRLRSMAEEYGGRASREKVQEALDAAARS